MGSLNILASRTAWYEQRIRSSRFLTLAQPVASRRDVDRCLKEARRDHPKASHHCYAYRLIKGTSAEIDEFSSDNGEPSGSAGAPILAALKRGQWVNVLVIVVRYYGGSKLGIPGLIAAYGDGASGSLDSGDAAEWIATMQWSLQVPLPLVERVKGTIRKLGGTVLSAEFDARAKLDVRLPLSQRDSFVDALQRLSGSGLKFEPREID